jgi:probable phosphoglycerate mutase
MAMSSESSWPEALWIVRHGQSAGNVAHEAAVVAGSARIEVAPRDMDVPLSELGVTQTRALARWFAALPEEERPTVALSSPYARAVGTAASITDALATGGKPVALRHDERLRERELGILNRLTKAGIIAQHPSEAELRAQLGKFYYRPPGGESWCDVILRLRSVLDHIQLRYRGERVLIVAHQVVVLCFRYLLEELDEERILAIDREKDVANCSITSYRSAPAPGGHGRMVLEHYNLVTPLEDAGQPVTKKPDPPVGAR